MQNIITLNGLKTFKEQLDTHYLGVQKTVTGSSDYTNLNPLLLRASNIELFTSIVTTSQTSSGYSYADLAEINIDDFINSATIGNITPWGAVTKAIADADYLPITKVNTTINAVSATYNKVGPNTLFTQDNHPIITTNTYGEIDYADMNAHAQSNHIIALGNLKAALENYYNKTQVDNLFTTNLANYLPATKSGTSSYFVDTDLSLHYLKTKVTKDSAAIPTDTELKTRFNTSTNASNLVATLWDARWAEQAPTRGFTLNHDAVIQAMGGYTEAAIIFRYGEYGQEYNLSTIFNNKNVERDCLIAGPLYRDDASSSDAVILSTGRLNDLYPVLIPSAGENNDMLIPVYTNENLVGSEFITITNNSYDCNAPFEIDFDADGFFSYYINRNKGLIYDNGDDTVGIDSNIVCTHGTGGNTYTKTEVDSLISNINQFEYVVVEAGNKPTASASTMYKIYLEAVASATGEDIYNEYITVRTGSTGSYTYRWELIGNTRIELTEATSASIIALFN